MKPTCAQPQRTNYSKPETAELRQKLTPEQFAITQEDATEAPFRNAYWDNKRAGIYVDVVSGEPLFSSLDKFDSGTGWPSFTKPIESKNLTTQTDRSLVMTRTEVRSASADSHLGHVFNDGPGPEGKRYCINSGALRFVPVDDLEKEGYGEYQAMFAASNPHSPAPTPEKTEDTAMLAGGCFWGIEEILRQQAGVLDVVVGYTGGSVDNPVYKLVSGGSTGHAEAVKIKFNPQIISYEQLLGLFFRLHDPTTLNRQGNDIGSQYRSAVFYLNDEQREIAEKVKKQVDASGKWKHKVVTEIVAAKKFYEAEEYHQDYLQKNPGGYTCHYLRD